VLESVISANLVPSKSENHPESAPVQMPVLAVEISGGEEIPIEKKKSTRLMMFVFFIMLFVPHAYGQDFSKVEIKTIKVADGI
jgi:hypothetical protein